MTRMFKVLIINALIVGVVWGSITLGLAYSLGVQGIGPGLIAGTALAVDDRADIERCR